MSVQSLTGGKGAIPPAAEADPISLRVEDLVVTYGRGVDAMRANDGVSLDVPRGATLAVIGESGCGKSSLGKAICGLVPITSGRLTFEGQPLAGGGDSARRAGRAGIQIVLQDPSASLDARWPIWRSVAESRYRFGESKAESRRRAVAALEEVAIGAHLVDRRPAELSGGQRQRVTIARAIAAEPRLIVLDEAVSALDVSVRNEILALLRDVKERHGLTYVFISHDISVVTQAATHVAVMYLGQIVETGTVQAVVHGRHHPYTKALLSAVPTLRGDLTERMRLTNELPSPKDPPKGCRFHTRCLHAQSVCRSEEPQLLDRDGGRFSACHFVGDLLDVERRTRQGE